jgi:hypothetical protein
MRSQAARAPLPARVPSRIPGGFEFRCGFQGQKGIFVAISFLHGHDFAMTYRSITEKGMTGLLSAKVPSLSVTVCPGRAITRPEHASPPVRAHPRGRARNCQCAITATDRGGNHTRHAPPAPPARPSEPLPLLASSTTTSSAEASSSEAGHSRGTA